MSARRTVEEQLKLTVVAMSAADLSLHNVWLRYFAYRCR